NSDSEPAIEKSLAEAFDMQGDAHSAEEHFQRAVSTAHARRITPDKETDILQGIRISARANRPARGGCEAVSGSCQSSEAIADTRSCAPAGIRSARRQSPQHDRKSVRAAGFG